MAEIEDIIEVRKQKKLDEERKAKEREEKIKREQEAAKREREYKKAAEKRKSIPPFVMLIAGAIVSVSMLLLRFSLKRMLPILLCVLIAFYIIGELMKMMFDRFALQNYEAKVLEGEVIEKEQETEEVEKES